MYIFSNTNFPIKEISRRGKIKIDLIFSTISSVVSPQTQDVPLPSLVDFQLVEKDQASTIIAPKLSYTAIGTRIVNQQSLPRSLRLSRVNTKNFNLNNPSSIDRTYKVRLEYLNG